MPVKGYQQKAEREMKAAENQKDRDLQMQIQDMTSRRNLLGSVLGTAASLFPKGKYDIGGGKSASKSNDISWHGKVIPLESVGSIPTYLRMGKGFSKVTRSSGSTEFLLQGATPASGETAAVLPTNNADNLEFVDSESSSSDGSARIIVHEFLPNIGSVSADGKGYAVIHPINDELARDIAHLGSVNSRVIDPDVSVPGMYFIAATDIYSLLAELKVVIQLAYKYSGPDAQLGDSLISAKGWDPQFIRENLPILKVFYTRYATLVNNTIPIPANLSYLARRLWINTVIIKDDSTDKAAYVCFKQLEYGHLLQDGTEFSYVKPYNTSGQDYDASRPDSIDDLTTLLDTMINNLVINDDFMTFIANMLQAKWTFACLPVDHSYYEMEISTNDEVLLQIMNIKTIPGFYRNYFGINGISYRTLINGIAVVHDASGRMHQSFPGITTSDMNEYKRLCLGVIAYKSQPHRLNSYIGWSPDKFMLATRLRSEFNVNWSKIESTIRFNLSPISVGTEVIYQTSIYYYHKETAGSPDVLMSTMVTSDMFKEASTGAASSLQSSITTLQHSLLTQINGMYAVSTLAALTLTVQNAQTASGMTKWITIPLYTIEQICDLVALEDYNLCLLTDASVRSLFSTVTNKVSDSSGEFKSSRSSKKKGKNKDKSKGKEKAPKESKDSDPKPEPDKK